MIEKAVSSVTLYLVDFQQKVSSPRQLSRDPIGNVRPIDGATSQWEEALGLRSALAARKIPLGLQQKHYSASKEFVSTPNFQGQERDNAERV